jgi:hypothetical protein
MASSRAFLTDKNLFNFLYFSTKTDLEKWEQAGKLNNKLLAFSSSRRQQKKLDEDNIWFLAT